MMDSNSAPIVLVIFILAATFLGLLILTQPWMIKPKGSRTRFLQRISTVVLAVVSSVACVVGAYILSGNVHTVVAGELYRSGQLAPKTLKSLTARYGIRTIINLRGENKNSAWYEREVALSRSLGINHVDFRMAAKRELPDTELVELIGLMKNAVKPVLIHCSGGADRTGLVSALYLVAITGLNEEEAEWQLSPMYGHFGIPFLSSSYAMDSTWERIERLMNNKK